jgi:hypothetical protein
MKGFKLTTSDNIIIHFNYYNDDAPVTCKAFNSLLPFKRNFMHARVSGQEIWNDASPSIDIMQENASVFTEPGEVVYGPAKPARTKTKNAMGIYYGEGKGLDAANIFAKVYDEDLATLKKLGERIWKKGEVEITFEKL